MNPKEFWWTDDQQVTVTNPTEQTYKFKVHGKEYELAAHKTAKMPGYIAWVYVYGLSTQMAQADGNFNRWNEEDYRPEYYNKLVKDVDAIVQDVITEEPNPIEELDDEPAAEEPENAPEPTPEAQHPLVGQIPDEELTGEQSAPASEPTGDQENTADADQTEPTAGELAQVQPMAPKPRAKALRNS